MRSRLVAECFQELDGGQFYALASVGGRGIYSLPLLEDANPTEEDIFLYILPAAAIIFQATGPESNARATGACASWLFQAIEPVPVVGFRPVAPSPWFIISYQLSVIYWYF